MSFRLFGNINSRWMPSCDVIRIGKAARYTVATAGFVSSLILATRAGRIFAVPLAAESTTVASVPTRGVGSTIKRLRAERTRKSSTMLEQLTLNVDGLVLDESTPVNSRVLPYVQMVVSVLEGRTISREELLTVLRTRLRQRSIGRLSRREYVLHYLNQHPP